MKNTILSLVAMLLLSTSLFAQAPQSFKYQAVVRNASGAILVTQPVGMQLTILQGGPSGTIVYSETFATTTNSYGLVDLGIGQGTTVDDFTAIDWANGPFFIEIGVDVTGGTSYSVMGTSELLSVPYALYADQAGSVVNDQVDDADADPSNEIQALSFSNDTLYLSNGGQVYLGDYAIDLVDDADADPTNEYNTSIALNGTDLETTDGGGTIVTDLSSLQDGTGTDDQQLSLAGTNLSIEDGNTVDLSVLQDGVNDADADPTNEMNTGLTLNGTAIEITDGNGTLSQDLDGTFATDAELAATAAAIVESDPVFTASPAGGITAGDITNWNNDLVDDADADPANEIQTLSVAGSNLSLSNGGGTVSLNDADADPTNELQDISLAGTNLSITSGSTVDLSSLQDGTGTDDQQLTLAGTDLSIEDGNTVDLAVLQDGTGTDDQNISGSGLVGTNLTIGIEGGTSEVVDLSSLQDGTGTDDQMISFDGLSTVTLEDGGSVDLSALYDNTDNQILSLSGNDLTISGGNTVTLPNNNDADWNVVGSNLESGVSGNVGIGRTNPLYKIDVIGNARLGDTSQNLGGGNFRHDLEVRASSGYYIYRQMYEGYEGGYWANQYFGTGGPVAITPGSSHNIGLGGHALRFLTSGSNNLALGWTALYNTTTGGMNVAVGTQSVMRENVSGSRNIAMGNMALRNSTAGNDNVSIGVQSGYNSQGNRNVYIGYQAGYNETGSDKLYLENSNSTTPLIYGDFANDSVKVYGTISVGDNYTLPAADGNSGDVMVTDGLGNVSWQAPTGGADTDWTVAGNNMYNNNTGNNGIGTTTPNYKLHMHTDVNSIMQFTTTSTGTGALDGLLIGNNSINDAYIIQRENANLFIRTSNTDRITIDGTGNVGVGTSTPSATLDVTGTMQYVDGNQSAGRVLTSDANGNASWQDPAGGVDPNPVFESVTIDPDGSGPQAPYTVPSSPPAHIELFSTSPQSFVNSNWTNFSFTGFAQNIGMNFLGGGSVNFTKAGTYLVTLNFSEYYNSAWVAFRLYGADGSQAGISNTVRISGAATLTRSFLVTVNSGLTYYLQAFNSGGNGTSGGTSIAGAPIMNVQISQISE